MLQGTELPQVVGDKLLRVSSFDKPRASVTHLKIAALLQELIVDRLDSVQETKAANWFYETWTGEHSSYTNASAGYVGTADANGTESR